MEELKMKNTTTRENFVTIQGAFENQGITLSIDIPERLMPSFISCFDEGNDIGAKLLEDLYDLFTSLSEKQKEIFQHSIYANADHVNHISDVIIMLRCLKRVFGDLDC